MEATIQKIVLTGVRHATNGGTMQVIAGVLEVQGSHARNAATQDTRDDNVGRKIVLTVEGTGITPSLVGSQPLALSVKDMAITRHVATGSIRIYREEEVQMGTNNGHKQTMTEIKTTGARVLCMSKCRRM
eukprot:PhF_6_TR20782/c0_g1_i1/m.29834